MARYLVILFFFIIVGCSADGEIIIKPEKFKNDVIYFDTVSKKLIYEEEILSDNNKNFSQLFQYWFDNKIKTNGFNGDLKVFVKDLEISETKNKEYYKYNIKLSVNFLENKKNNELNYKISLEEFSELKGSFSINDQETLALNTIYNLLKNLSDKILEFKS